MYKLTHWINEQKGEVFGDDPIALLSDWVVEVEWKEILSAIEVYEVLDKGKHIEFKDENRGVRLVKVQGAGSCKLN